MLPLELKLNPASQWRRGFLLLIFSLSMLACIAMQSLIGLLLLPILAFIFVMYWRSAETVCLLRVHESGALEFRDRQGLTELMDVLPSSVVTSMLIVLHLKGVQRNISVLVWPDSAPPEVLRQWRVWLRWTGKERARDAS